MDTLNIRIEIWQRQYFHTATTHHFTQNRTKKFRNRDKNLTYTWTSTISFFSEIKLSAKINQLKQNTIWHWTKMFQKVPCQAFPPNCMSDFMSFCCFILLKMLLTNWQSVLAKKKSLWVLRCHYSWKLLTFIFLVYKFLPQFL